MKRPLTVYILSLLLLFLSAGAIYGGGSMIISPDGSLLKMENDWLEMIPFPDFMIPGLILFFFLGIFPLVSLTGLFVKKNNRWFNLINIFKDKYWGWSFTLYTGIISIIWIVIQQLLTSYFVLQPIITATGILIIILSLTPEIQKYYSIKI